MEKSALFLVSEVVLHYLLIGYDFYFWWHDSENQ